MVIIKFHVTHYFNIQGCLQFFLLCIKPLSHQAAFLLRWHGVFFKFSEPREIASKSSYFSQKRAYHGVLTVTMALLLTSHDVLLRSYAVLVLILCALTMLSLRFPSARKACTAFSRRPHCTDGVLKTQCRDSPPFQSFGQGPV